MSIHYQRIELDSELMRSAGHVLSTIGKLLHENAMRSAFEGEGEFLDNYTSGGLFEAVALIGRQLSIAGEELEELVEEEREKTLAELQLGKGNDANDDLGRKVGSESDRAIHA